MAYGLTINTLPQNPMFADANKWVQAGQLDPVVAAARLQPRITSPISDLGARSPIADLTRPPAPSPGMTLQPMPSPLAMEMTPSTPGSVSAPGAAPQAPSTGGVPGFSGGVMPVSLGGGGYGFANAVGDAARSDAGRGILSAVSAAGYAFPNPISTAAGLVNAGASAANMVDLNNVRGSYGMPDLSPAQFLGGMMGLNDYASPSRGFDASMAHAISNNQDVTVPMNLAVLAAPPAASPGGLGGMGGMDGGWNYGSGIPGDFAFSDPSMGGYDFGFSGGPGY